jgi:hypothetical protein
MQEARSYALAGSAALGPIALGAVLGAQISPWVALRQAALVPAIVVGLTAATVPALYIATVATGSRLTAATLARAVLRGLEGLGVVLLGLVGPLAFVASTSRYPKLAVLLGAVCIATAAALGLRRMRAAMTPDGSPSLVDGGLFVLWGAVAAVLGARLYFDLMAIGPLP